MPFAGRPFFALFIALAALIVPGLSPSVQADTPPIPQRKAGLERIEQQISEQKTQQKDLKTSLNKAQTQLGETKKALVSLGREMQNIEEKLNALHKKITRAEAHKKVLTARLEEHYGSLSDLALALNRIRRLPPETLIARPGAPLETAQSAMLLQSTLPAIESRTASLKEDLANLAVLQDELQQDKSAQEEKQSALAQKEKDLDSLLAQRQQLYTSTNINYARNTAHLDRLAKEAKDLKALLKKLEEEDRKRRQAEVAAAAKANKAQRTARNNTPHRVALPPTGPSNLPVAGTILTAYGQTDDIGAQSQGLHMQTRPQALVTAPMGGVVRFAGTFKNYGQMVVLEHRNGYHSLIGGLGSINVKPDDRLDAGEPLGRMPSSASHQGSLTLYYELRYQGHPVDPAQKLSGLR